MPLTPRRWTHAILGKPHGGIIPPVGTKFIVQQRFFGPCQTPFTRRRFYLHQLTGPRVIPFIPPPPPVTGTPILWMVGPKGIVTKITTFSATEPLENQ